MECVRNEYEEMASAEWTAGSVLLSLGLQFKMIMDSKMRRMNSIWFKPTMAKLSRESVSANPSA